jgi:type IV secretion system protein VirB2/type IV secretion system protein PtlA
MKHMTRNALIGSVLALACLFALEPAFAQAASGGLDKVNTFMESILAILRGVSIITVTLAIMWAGYKFLFQHAGLRDLMPIIGGGLLIGGASEVAIYLLA